MVIPGMFIMGPGTNGHTAWGQTQLFGDITDWYVDELQLDENGLPASTTFQGQTEPVIAVDETYTIRDVPILGSTGRTETWTRWTTFDGRPIVSIEGRSASPDDPLEAGESLTRILGDWIVPQYTDGDGVITAISLSLIHI